MASLVQLAALLIAALLATAPATGRADEDSWQDAYNRIQLYGRSAQSVVELADQASVRLAGASMYIDDAKTVRDVLGLLKRPVPDNLLGLLRLPDGPPETMSMSWGTVRYIPAGSLDADALESWTPDDLLASLRGTLTRQNQEHPDLQPKEARGWIVHPQYDRKLHLLVWAPLVVPVDTPQGTGGEVVYKGVAFGRDGFIEVAMVSTIQHGPYLSGKVLGFLRSIQFNAGKEIDPQAKPTGTTTALAGVMSLDGFRRVGFGVANMSEARLAVLAAAGVGALGGASLLFYWLRHRRRDARRW